jgi:hypothetical protein
VYVLPLSKIELDLKAGRYEVTWLDPITGTLMHNADLVLSTNKMVEFQPPGAQLQTDLVLKVENIKD